MDPSQRDGTIPAYNPSDYHQYGTNEAPPTPAMPTPPAMNGPPHEATHAVELPAEYYPPPPGPPPIDDGLPVVSPPGQSEFYPPPPGEQLSTCPPPMPARPVNQYLPPPKRVDRMYSDDDLSDPVHYTRDPHKLVAYLVPFPQPQIAGVDTARIPQRFVIYTPPPPPLQKPAEGEKEAKLHKAQRKWQEEVRTAKTSTAKTASWKGLKAVATKGISHAMDYTKSSDLEFLNRVPGSSRKTADATPHDAAPDGSDTKTIGLEEMVLIYPNSMPQTPVQMREEFVNSMMRSKSKAQRDAVIATGLLPVSLAIDVLATVIWPFGGLLEIDSVWAYSSIRGAKASRSVTKRLSSTGENANPDDNQLQLNFRPAARLQILRKYLACECHKYDAKLFPGDSINPTETDVLAAIGWTPSQTGGATKNWEDEQWEMAEVKDDVKAVMHKAAREWTKWCRAFAKDPEKALKK